MPSAEKEIGQSLENHRISTKKMSIKAMEKWLWDAACSIRGQQDAPKFKDFILPLVFYKRLSDVFDDEIQQHIEEYGDKEIALEIIEEDHKDALKSGRKGIVRFFIPQTHSWTAIRNHGANGRLGEFVTEAMRETGRLNPELADVLTKDFNETQSGQRNLDDERLANLIEGLSSHRLGLEDAEPDILGRAYEYLLRKFAEGQGQSAGEFYTPKEVGWLMAKLLDPKPKSTVYDPTCGSGSLLIKTRMVYEEHHPDERSKSPRLFGQELTATSFAIAKMNMFSHGYTSTVMVGGIHMGISDFHLAIGDTLRTPRFASEGGGLTQYDYAIANPMWNQTGYDQKFYEADKWGRFTHGNPGEKADWAWLQHMLASLKPDGKAAVVLDTGAVSRGSGSQNRDKEREVRKSFIEADVIEAVILLPENLFYNTTAPGIIVMLHRDKPKERKGKIMLINASQLFTKGKPKNEMTSEGIRKVCEAYTAWKEVDKLSRIVTTKQAVEHDYNLSPSQYVDVGEKTDHRGISDILADLKRVKAERTQVDSELEKLINSLNLAA